MTENPQETENPEEVAEDENREGGQPSGGENVVSIGDFQALIREMYFEKDEARGIDGTFMWLMEEVGELASALRGSDRINLEEEFADVLAWLTTIANVADIDLTKAIARKYGSGCPGCNLYVCQCDDAGKP
jgi:NTP pyrophosphatase (non-canonical NTP hydrolase)